MADVLSQDQIDALLKSMAGGGGDSAPAEETKTEEVKPAAKKAEEKRPAAAQSAEEKKYNKYDFYSPRKFTKERMKMLTSS